ncbi:MAG: type II toxin-antitoxin system YafQ family toxin [Prevotella sp.]|nr:type II toxin-antitoxin system YafQ family toxin [Succinivibrionaceae bacterium]MDY6376753.1 type II toxin-antitoxin system YafQ family toxin [Succinivibrionaceae bacterium]MEE3446815.1 type II toxin-antitoxin system YafQ family toxin [Prevotella sp.]
MMYTVKFTSSFKKSYKLMKKRGLDISLLDAVIDDLRCGRQLDKKFHDHGLTGNLAEFRECHIRPDWLLVYMVEDDILTLTMVDTGTHSDIFKW